MDYLLLALQSALSVFGIRAAYEQPAYEVLEALPGGAEVRRYAPRLAAETTVQAASEDAGRNEGFNRLAKYIFGANRPAAAASQPSANSGEMIAMTSPVQTAGGKGATIAMTAPVQTSGGKGANIAMTAPVQTGRAVGATDAPSAPARGGAIPVTMRFFLPGKLTAANAPVPDDPRVRIVPLAPETSAVLRFSGRSNQSKLDAKTAALLKSLESSPWRATGEPYTLFYDPPFAIPFLRRNEVVVPVDRRPG